MKGKKVERRSMKAHAPSLVRASLSGSLDGPDARQRALTNHLSLELRNAGENLK